MQNVLLRQDWSTYKAGEIVGVEDNIADNLRKQGVAYDPNAVAPAAPKKATKKKTSKKK